MDLDGGGVKRQAGAWGRESDASGVDRELYVELPEDDEQRQGGANVGLLNKAMYGTRDAPAAWSRLVRSMLADLGFTA